MEEDKIPSSVKDKFKKDIDEQIRIEKANKRKSSKKIKRLGKINRNLEQRDNE